MKQPSAGWQTLITKQKGADNALLKHVALVLGLGTLGLIMLTSLIYLPFSVSITPMPVEPAAGGSVEQTLGAEYVLQTSFLFGRYALPFLISLVGAGIILVFVLRSKSART